MDISSDKLVKPHTRRHARNGNFKRETKSLLITAQNNAIRTTYIKIKIDTVNRIASVDYVGT